MAFGDLILEKRLLLTIVICIVNGANVVIVVVSYTYIYTHTPMSQFNQRNKKRNFRVSLYRKLVYNYVLYFKSNLTASGTYSIFERTWNFRALDGIIIRHPPNFVIISTAYVACVSKVWKRTSTAHDL